MSEEYYLKYGGVKFVNNVPPEQINEFVMGLPEEKKASLYSIAKELMDNGLIDLKQGQFSTIDNESIEYFH